MLGSAPSVLAATCHGSTWDSLRYPDLQSTYWFKRINGTWQDRPVLFNRFSSGTVSISNDGCTLAIEAETEPYSG